MILVTSIAPRLCKGGLRWRYEAVVTGNCYSSECHLLSSLCMDDNFPSQPHVLQEQKKRLQKLHDAPSTWDSWRDPGWLAGDKMDAHKCLRGKTALWRLSLLSGLLTKRKCLGPPLLPPASSGDEWLAHGAGLAGIWGGHVGCLGLCSPQQSGKLRWHMPCVLLLPDGKAPNARHPHALATL